MIHRLLRYLWYTTATVVIGIALLLSTVRLVLPMLDGYRVQLQDWVVAQTGQDIRIGQLDIAWRGLGPEVRLLDTVILNPDSNEPLLEVDALGLGFDFWRYVQKDQLKTKWISLEGSDIRLQEYQTGQWRLLGSQSVTEINPLTLLLSQPRIELEDVTVTLYPHESRGLDTVELQDIELQLRSRNNRHVLSLNTLLDGTSSVELTLDLAEDAQQRWSGQGYVGLKQLPLNHWLARLLPDGLAATGHLDGEFWFDLRNNQPQRLQSQFVLTDLTLAESTGALLQTERLQSAMLWHMSQQGWILEFTDLSLTTPNMPASTTQGRVIQTTLADGETHWQVDVRDLATGPYLTLINYFAPEQYRSFIAQSSPSVHFDQAQVAFVQADKGTRLESLTGKFDRLDVTAFDAWPGVTNLSGVLSLQPMHGEMVFTSSDATLDLPALFRDTFSVSAFQGELSWQYYDDRWRLQSPDLYLETPDLKLQQRLRLDIPHAEGSPYLELRGNFKEGKVSAVHRFLPANIMPVKPVEWLDGSLKAGVIQEGELLFQGRLNEFPYDAGEGRMEIRARVTDGVLQFHPDWPGISGIDADLAFINRTMTITSDQARIYDTALRDVTVAIPNLLNSRLQVSGQAVGDLGDMLLFVNNSPLAERGYPVAQLSGSGNAELDLDMAVRINRKDPLDTTLKGQVQFANNQLLLSDWDIRLDAIEGQLQFTENGLMAERIQTRIWDSPAELSIKPGAVDGRSQIRLQGALPLLEQLPRESPLHQYLSGRSNWTVQIGLQRERQGIDLTLQSDLRGIAVNLPAPLGKTPSREQNLRILTQLGQAQQPRVMLSYGPHSAAMLLNRTNNTYALQEAVVLFNEGPATLKGVAGLHVGGRLEALALKEWQDLQSSTSNTPPGAAMRSVDISVQQLKVAGRTLQDVALQAEQNDAGWQLAFAGPMLDGEVFVPHADMALPVELRFDRLVLPTGRNGEDKQLDPQDIPTLNFSAREFQYGSYELGRVELKSRRTAEGMLIDNLLVDAPWIEMTAEGSWLKGAGRESSRFQIDLQDGDLGELLATFGYAGNIVGGDTRGTLDANWIGGPHDFALEKLEGELDLAIGSGSITQLEPGAGRVFGLLNLQSLPRRLSLDFSDLFSKGFAFDRIDGSFTLIDSDAYTNNLTIEGPSARIEISGRTGLAARDYDQLVTVVPQVSSGIPVAGALAGGPAVGAALFLADQLFGKEIEKFSRYQYSVTGSWRNPQFTRLSSQGNSDTAPASE